MNLILGNKVKQSLGSGLESSYICISFLILKCIHLGSLPKVFGNSHGTFFMNSLHLYFLSYQTSKTVNIPPFLCSQIFSAMHRYLGAMESQMLSSTSTHPSLKFQPIIVHCLVSFPVSLSSYIYFLHIKCTHTHKILTFIDVSSR